MTALPVVALDPQDALQHSLRPENTRLHPLDSLAVLDAVTV